MLAPAGILPYIIGMTQNATATALRPDGPARRDEFKTERMELRLAPSAKQIIQRAMALTGMAAADLAYEGARRVLAEHDRMVLAGADRDAFLRAVENPPVPNDELVTALRRHRDLLG